MSRMKKDNNEKNKNERPVPLQSYNAINESPYDQINRPVSFLVKQSGRRLTCARVFFVIINFHILLIGLALLAIGIAGFVYLDKFFAITGHINIYVPAAFVVVGLFLSFVSSMACCCDPQHNFVGFFVYSFVQFLCALAIIASMFIFYEEKPEISKSFRTGFKTDVLNYTKYESEVDLIQRALDCCGSTNYTDYFHTPWAGKLLKVPKSCCLVEESTCRNTFLLPNQENDDIADIGCADRVNTILDDGFWLIISVGCGCAFFPLLGFLLSCCMMKMSRKQNLEFQRLI